MKQIKLRMPGSGGINTDSPPWAIKSDQAISLVDGVPLNGTISQRRGWTYTTQPVPSVGDVDSHGQHIFRIGDRRKARVAIADNKVYVQDDAGDWQAVFDIGATISPADGGVLPQYVPRGMYHDELILCPVDGEYPVLRWAGANSNSYTVGNGTYTSERDTVAGTFSGGGIGMYWNPEPATQITSSLKAIEHSPTSMTLEQFFPKASDQLIQPGARSFVSAVGATWPGQKVYEVGRLTGIAGTTASFDGAVFVGSGAKWGGVIAASLAPTQASDFYPESLAAASVFADGLMIERKIGDAYTWTIHPILVAEADSLTIPAGVDQNNITGRYAILRRMACSDVAVRDGSVFYGGNKQHPSRVWFSAPSWNPALPAAFGPTFGFPLQSFTSEDEFLLNWIEVPADGDGDTIVALVESDGPVIVLKQNSAHSLTGTYPAIKQTLLSNNAGCIDVRSAIDQRGYGSFWCGRSGIYAYRFGNITDITSDRVGDEWRERIRLYDPAFGSSVTCGIFSGFLFVAAHLTDGVTTDDFTWMCNLSSGAWTEMSNMPLRSMQNVRTLDGNEKLLGTLYGDKRAVDISQITRGDVTDGNGVIPKLEMSVMAAPDESDPDNERRMIEATVVARLQDTSSDSSKINVSVTATSALDEDTASAKDCGDMSATSSPTLKRNRFRVGTVGRQHTVTVTADPAADNTAIELHEVTVVNRDKRPLR